MRKLRIYANCGEKPSQPINVVLQTVLKVLVQAERVDNQENADLIIIDNFRKVAGNYHEDKQYVLLDYSQQERVSMPDLPNFTRVGVSDCLAQLLQISSRIKLEADAKVAVSAVEPEVSTEKLGMPWILVVDDKPENRQAAYDQLGNDFNLVVAEGFDRVRQAFKERKFAYALIDLHLPVATGGALGEAGIARHIGMDIPYGLFLLLEACQEGAHAAVVTDLNHHQDPFSAAFDYYAGRPMIINGKKALLLHAQLITGGAKDWRWALDRLIS